jgi:transposase InsO family protein
MRGHGVHPLTLQALTSSVEEDTVTKDERIFSHRKACLAYAVECGNVAQAARVFDISRTTFYEWRSRAQRYGLAALWPRERRRPVQPNAMAPWEVQAILAEAIAHPTMGARRLLDGLALRGVHRSASGVQKVLRRHGLATRNERVAALAHVTAITDGTVVEQVAERVSGFCHVAAFPGDLVALDAFYVGKLKGVGKVWQLTAVDHCTRWTIAELFIDDHTAATAAAFLDVVIDRFAQLDVEVTGILTDRGPEFVGRDFQDHVADLGIDHTLTPPASPDHNAVVESVQGLILQEFYRPTFHRQFISDIAWLNHQLQAHLHRFNTVRRNHGDYMAGRRPIDALEFKQDQLANVETNAA